MIFYMNMANIQINQTYEDMEISRYMGYLNWSRELKLCAPINWSYLLPKGR